MPEKSITVYKEIGETPLECLERARIDYDISANIPMTYAGRLDPMAEGLMIILIGDECKNKEKYLGLDKTYEFQILVGFSTDTYDLLGVVSNIASPGLADFSQLNPLYGDSDADLKSTQPGSVSVISNSLPSFTGKFIQKYPSFSSKTVGGKQLFQLSKDDELPDELPEHEVTIYSLLHTDTEIFKKDDLRKEIVRRISLVKGDFRQDEIIEKWNEVLDQSDQEKFTIISCIANCSSGTYIRQLVNDIGEKVGISLVTYSIKRTKIGDSSN